MDDRINSHSTNKDIEEKIKIGLIPHVQGMLFSAYMRGDIDAYPPFLIKG